jgi:hypothetical protein
MYTRAHQPSADTLKAEARNFAKIISGDKRKSQTYCKIVELNDQIDEKEDPIEARKLTRKRDKLRDKLGRKYVALAVIVNAVLSVRLAARSNASSGTLKTRIFSSVLASSSRSMNEPP